DPKDDRQPSDLVVDRDMECLPTFFRHRERGRFGLRSPMLPTAPPGCRQPNLFGDSRGRAVQPRCERPVVPNLRGTPRKGDECGPEDIFRIDVVGQQSAADAPDEPTVALENRVKRGVVTLTDKTG